MGCVALGMAAQRRIAALEADLLEAKEEVAVRDRWMDTSKQFIRDLEQRCSGGRHTPLLCSMMTAAMPTSPRPMHQPCFFPPLPPFPPQPSFLGLCPIMSHPFLSHVTIRGVLSHCRQALCCGQHHLPICCASAIHCGNASHAGTIEQHQLQAVIPQHPV